jgi:hypothetical protein
MPPTDPEPMTPNRPGEAAGNGPTEPQSSTGRSTLVPDLVHGLWGWVLGAGVLAGLLTWGGGEVAWEGVRSAQAPKIIARPTAADRDTVIRQIVSSTAVSFIQEGAILGVVLGLAGGFARRSARAALLAALVGGGLGAAVAAAAAHGLLPIYYRNVDDEGSSLTLPLLTHGGIWAAAGAVAGLAFGLGLGGRGRWLRCALGGLLGGIAATMVYELVGALAFPLDKTSQPVSATVVSRLFAQFTVAVFVAAAAGLGLAQSPSSRRAPADP